MPDWRAALPALQFWQLELLLAAVVALSLLELPSIVRAIGASSRGWLGALAAAALAWSLTAGLAPQTNRILYDEHIYQHIGQNMADRHRAEMCNDGRIASGRLDCRLAEYNKQPNGYPHLLSVVYRVAGVDERHAWTVNNAAAAALPLVLFAATALLFGDRRAGLLAALAIALMPHQLIWSNTAAAEPTAALAGAVAVLTAAWFASSGRTRALALAVVATAWACQFRPESPLVVPIAGAIVLSGVGGQWRQPRLWVAAAAGAAALVPLALHVAAVSGQSWGAPGERLSLGFVTTNLSVNGPFYVTNVRFPVALTLLSAAGAAVTWRAAATKIVVAYFGAVWGVYLFFYAGSYDYGADVRYSLLTYPPLAILAGLGASAAVGWIGRWWWRLAVPATVVASCVPLVPLVRQTGEDGWQARADVAAARTFAAVVPSGGVVLTHNPSMFLLFGVDAAQLSLAVHDPVYLGALTPRAPGGVFFHLNFWCIVNDPVQTRFCTEFQAHVPLELVAERHARAVRYALYRVRP